MNPIEELVIHQETSENINSDQVIAEDDEMFDRNQWMKHIVETIREHKLKAQENWKNIKQKIHLGEVRILSQKERGTIPTVEELIASIKWKKLRQKEMLSVSQCLHCLLFI